MREINLNIQNGNILLIRKRRFKGYDLNLFSFLTKLYIKFSVKICIGKRRPLLFDNYNLLL